MVIGLVNKELTLFCPVISIMATYSYELFVLTLYNVTVKALQAMWSLQMLILKQHLFLDTCKCTAVSHTNKTLISVENMI